ncbi:DUF805 domain-containing protein [Staphylococcus argensis]|nr:DUF805 domain-containing protein [Staphylococcus argensis]MCY6992012.1 DUF805 domain-containing protein [Staphylococcus argensis]
MRFGQAFKSYWKNYANFKGRARSSEVWWMALWNFLMVLPIILYYILYYIASLLVLTTMDDTLLVIITDTFGILTAYVFAYILVTFIPNLSLVLRRFHDIGQHGILQISLFAITFLINSVLTFWEFGLVLHRMNSFAMTSYAMTSDDTGRIINLVLDILSVSAMFLSFIMFIYFIIIACLDSKKGRNKYGESTKYP